MTKIDLITGILGSGKTTFLLHYAKHFIRKGQKIAILENDFGAVNVDMMILQELKGENCQLEMVAGGGDQHCHRRRFKTQLIALGMQHLDRVIIEPSGIFDMDEFFDTLHESPLDRWFEIGSILTIVDAEMQDTLSEQMEYLLGSEASCCGKLVLSKFSSDGSEPLPALSERVLAHLNRALAYIKCDRRFQENDLFIKPWEDLTDAEFSLLSSAGYRNSSYVKLFSPEHIQSSVHYFLHICIPENRIAETVQAVMQDVECGHIFRIKGALPKADGSCLKLNVTREKLELSPVPEGQAVLIVIGDDLQLDKLNSYFQAVNTDPEFVSI